MLRRSCLRAIDVKAHTNDPVRVLTETDYSAVIRGTVYPSARLIWSVPLEDARYWHNAYNVLTVDPVIGRQDPRRCARHLQSICPPRPPIHRDTRRLLRVLPRISNRY